MSAKREQVEQIVATVPNFRKRWERFLQEWEGEEKIPYYVGFSELAHYVVESYAQDFTSEFSKLFGTIENLLQRPEPELENLIAVGLFEDIQNIAGHRDFGATPFRKWLGSPSIVVWDEIDAGMQRVTAWTARNKPRWWQFWRRRRAFDARRALEQVESPELRKIIEANYRKTKE